MHPPHRHTLVLIVILMNLSAILGEDCDSDAEIELKKLWEVYQEHESSGDYSAVLPGLLPHLSENCDSARRKRHSIRPNIVKKERHHHERRYHRSHLRNACAQGFTRVGSLCRPVLRVRRSIGDQESRFQRSYLGAKLMCPKGYFRIRFRCVPLEFLARFGF